MPLRDASRATSCGSCGSGPRSWLHRVGLVCRQLEPGAVGPDRADALVRHGRLAEHGSVVYGGDNSAVPPGPGAQQGPPDRRRSSECSLIAAHRVWHLKRPRSVVGPTGPFITPAPGEPTCLDPRRWPVPRGGRCRVAARQPSTKAPPDSSTTRATHLACGTFAVTTGGVGISDWISITCSLRGVALLEAQLRQQAVGPHLAIRRRFVEVIQRRRATDAPAPASDG